MYASWVKGLPTSFQKTRAILTTWGTEQNQGLKVCQQFGVFIQRAFFSPQTVVETKCTHLREGPLPYIKLYSTTLMDLYYKTQRGWKIFTLYSVDKMVTYLHTIISLLNHHLTAVISIIMMTSRLRLGGQMAKKMEKGTEQPKKKKKKTAIMESVTHITSVMNIQP